jgi:hypothetical protein
MGCTAVVPYCLMLVRRCHYRGTGSGLPADDGHWKLPNNKRFKIRVLVPCFKVHLSSREDSVHAANLHELSPSKASLDNLGPHSIRSNSSVTVIL